MRGTNRALVAIVVVAAVACGGGGDDRAAPADYVRSVCSAIVGWVTTTGLQGQGLDALLLSGDPASIKSGVVSILTDIEGETADLRDRLAQAGAPDIDNGDDLATELREAFADIESAIADARRAAESLPTTNVTGTIAGVQGLIEDYTARVEGALLALDGLESKYSSAELQTAFDNEPACANL